MKKFHFRRGVIIRARASLLFVVVLLCTQIGLLQHYYVMNNLASAESVDQAYLAKLKRDRNKEVAHQTKLLFMGDIMLARSIGASIENGQDPFMHVRSQLSSHDVRIANIETTVADHAVSTQASKPYTFNAPLQSLTVLKNAQIDVSSLANNHTGDFGRLATSDTVAQFKRAGLLSVGAGNTVEDAFAPVYIEKNGFKLAFIAVNDIELVHTKVAPGISGSAYLDKDLITRSIAQARASGADVVFVLPHWGIEYSLTESQRQRDWGRFMIDAGATAVIGGHPHVIQPTEKYNDGYIIYSLGNFIFDGMSGEALRGQMVSIELTKTTKGFDLPSLTMDEPRSIEFTIDAQGFPAP